jgi:quercetin dioxygenase-like cupin family protein
MTDEEGAAAEQRAADAEEQAAGGGEAGGETPAPHFVELWNDYDPSQRFAVIFPVSPDMGAKTSSVAYYIIEPGRHTGVHSDNAEEVVFITEGQGEVFTLGRVEPLEAGKFVVFPSGVEHDVYAHGGVALRLLSFYPVPEMVTTFQQVIFPMGSNTLSSSTPTAPVEVEGDAVPEDFPFDLGELEAAEREPTLTERLIGGPTVGSEDAGAEGPEPEAGGGEEAGGEG